MVILAYWGHHYSGVAAVTADKAEGIVEEDMVGEEMIDVENVEEVGYGKLVPWMEVPPSRRPRIMLFLRLCPRVPGVKILHRRLRRIPLMVGIR